MNDSIEFELVNWEPREVWKCQGQCARYRHRKVVKGIQPAVCCGVPAKLIDRYKQPIAILGASELPDETLESVMAQMQAAALLAPEPTHQPQQLQKDVCKS